MVDFDVVTGPSTAAPEHTTEHVPIALERPALSTGSAPEPAPPPPALREIAR